MASPAEIMTRVASTFNVAEGMVEAGTALIVAIGGLGALVGIKRRRAKRAESS